jgi:phosphatidate cytidylyltransferase
MLRERIISGLILGVLVLAAVIAGGRWIVLGVLGVVSIGLIEYVHLVARRGHRAFGGLMLLWAALFVADRTFPWLGLFGPGTALLLLATLGWALVRYRQGTSNAFTGFALTIAGSFYVGWSMAHFVGIRGMEDGLFWTLTVLFSVWCADTAAYVVGRLMGRARLAPDVSPNKTWAGYLGGVIVTPVVIAALTTAWQRLGAGEAVTWQHGLTIGLLVALIAPLGDLGISMIKRHVRVKDSSPLIPGHGGFLDRMDALLVAGLIGYYYLTLFVLR